MITDLIFYNPNENSDQNEDESIINTEYDLESQFEDKNDEEPLINQPAYDFENENKTEDTRHYTTHSTTGWVNATIWTKYLHFLRAQIPYIPNTDPNDEKIQFF